MIRRYPEKATEDEARAVELAVEKTMAMKTGDIRMKIVELTLMKGTHSIAGAALKCYCSESTAREYLKEFIRAVGKSFRCNGLW